MGNRLKIVRKKLGFSLEELAKKSGVSRQTIASIENEPDYNPSFGTLRKISNALGISIQDIFLT